jgi:hypothetical protein
MSAQEKAASPWQGQQAAETTSLKSWKDVNAAWQLLKAMLTLFRHPVWILSYCLEELRQARRVR